MANARSHTNRTKDLDKGDLRDSVKEVSNLVDVIG